MIREIKTLTDRGAEQIIDAIIAEAKNNGDKQHSITVTDAFGQMIAFAAMDGAQTKTPDSIFSGVAEITDGESVLGIIEIYGGTSSENEHLANYGKRFAEKSIPRSPGSEDYSGY